MKINNRSHTGEIHDGGYYHIETDPLICSVNQWTGFLYDNVPLHERVKVVSGRHVNEKSKLRELAVA